MYATCQIIRYFVMKNRFCFVIAALALATMVSCNPSTYKKINYMQDVTQDTTMNMAINKGIIIQPQDQLSIIVASRDPKLAAQFNNSISQYFTGSEIAASAGQQRLTGYVVDNDGYINFPALGKILVAGMNRWDLQNKIEEELASTGMLRDARVTVEFMNFRISVLGEVVSPGTYTITGDKITVFQALALARDLTIYGCRDNVRVVREQNGERQIYVLDLRDSEIFTSPAYYLQQNDVVYVTPNNVRAGQSTINENYFKSGAFWVSLGSIAISVTNLVATLIRYGK